MTSPVRRVVTGHDAQGRSIVVSDGAPPVVIRAKEIPGLAFHEIWATMSTPAALEGEGEPTAKRGIPPPPNGTVIRIVDIPPDKPLEADAARASFESLGSSHSATAEAASPHPLMHKTETVDYGIVLEGEIVLVLDNEERVLGPGDIVVQRGTNHAWANRSGRSCRMAFILIDARVERKG
ncbi:cupin domain-containing protein [Archangium minus]|uniref:Cupin domain-containing protein n=1 Tax=Archangium minus TaxID=83450 RepID=A0ABY9WXE9_9BACT|nr:cupin domain-containing protein [Archangium violaceum]WNG47836.1 cupin domain-containing protein [Archangium minus]